MSNKNNQAGAGKVEVPEGQTLIGKLLDDFSELPVLWGLNEPGALVRHGDVFRVIVDAGKAFPASPAAPVAEEEQSIEDRPENEQEWAKVDPATAFHLIERHAENWADAGRMMLAWRDANPAPATGEGQQQDEPVAWIRFRSDGGYEGPLMHSAMEEVRKKSGAWTPLYTRASLSSPAERQEAEAVVFLRQSSSFGPWIECKAGEEGAVRFAARALDWPHAPGRDIIGDAASAPSSPSVEIGTVDTPEFRTLMRALIDAYDDWDEDTPIPQAAHDAWNTLIAHIKQYAAQVAKAAREEALIEAAHLCDVKYEERAASGHIREASAARALSDQIYALRTPQPAADTEQGAK